jgi:hypothetical protein
MQLLKLLTKALSSRLASALWPRYENSSKKSSSVNGWNPLVMVLKVEILLLDKCGKPIMCTAEGRTEPSHRQK